jgi:Uroporphyrinogen decarboxylase (URO-D)
MARHLGYISRSEAVSISYDGKSETNYSSLIAYTSMALNNILSVVSYMIKETMTREQRIWTAVSLGIPDRIPVAPLIYQFVFRYQGIPHTVGLKDTEQAYKALSDTFDALGTYDAMIEPDFIWPVTTWRVATAPFRYVAPGRDVSEDQSLQSTEQELISIDDYDQIVSKGWNGFCEEFLPRVRGIPLERLDARQRRLADIRKRDVLRWEVRGVPVMSGAWCWSPMMILSMCRTLTQFTLDLYRIPDKVKAAMDAMVDDLISNVNYDLKFTGLPWVYFSLERGSGTYYPLKIFERFEFPYIKKMVEAFVVGGATPMLHFDTDWTLNLPYLKELPVGKCICELDSTSDIFKAKELLKGHMCIMGDVPASLLAVGTPEDVTRYCEKLIDIVGKGGGFILSTGCECPVDAKFDNVRAMIDSVKNHQPG